MGVVVFDQGWQVREGQFTIQENAVLLFDDRNRRIKLDYWSFIIFPHVQFQFKKKYSSKQQVSYLCEQSVVSGFADAYIPHHQHLDTKFINQDQIMGLLLQENVYYVHANLNILNTH